MSIILKDEAIFIADSHYNKKNQEFKIILEKIKNGEIFCKQIFLMGDNFDFLAYEINYFKKMNSESIELLNTLSNSFEIFYLEGNHDYNLSKIFPNIKVIKRENQPLLLEYSGKKLALSHGDNFINWHYNLYCKIIRNSYFLYFLNLLDINFFISKKIEKALENKNICHNLTYFEELVNKRVKNYSEDIIIEGHYHQAKSYKIGEKEYINIPSLCCQKSYTIFKDEKFTNIFL
ncbi:UDP-2,3-diacylglucosamine hydrolase [Aliarcobacter trophiarum LMG 25534]|uniref:UDP-2,3-diacylglucosamine hydrolase n=1 Tax=Aliarcobacter trophiarum LMG 25534 TaxID=1032241 RepID=A0AAD0VM63_9BACT|nr:metallophosphoesterase [Aliarcobacter trophiarum]AXK48555.1 UDP-2,3-diacylglucosamine hydrolase [Aliarcobacter trophiarum LMG 25534]RXI27645.1 UDP-2,3-diacylglucosamine hydrolase [Aliarcobacter trophiarum]RXJ89953.1 UDP-2,3-diacylglucosamine hydrolase [Aliarcobacter trophiarum LMG 25534]